MAKITADVAADILGSNVKGIPLEEFQPRVEPPKRNEKTRRIMLEESEHVTLGGIHVGLNGRTWKIRPGVEVDVPLGVIEILNNAVEERPVIDQNTGRIIGYRRKMRYPYQLVPTRAEREAREIEDAA